jgi:fucose permease
MVSTRQLALASLGFVSLGLPEGLLGVAWPSIRASFGLPLDALGLLLATFATGYFASSAASGRVIGRFGIGAVLAASCGLTGIALLGYSLAPGWSSMVALGFVLGLGAGTIDAGLNTYAAMAHGPRVLNWMHAAYGIGAAVGPLVMTAILSAGLAWNVGYAGVALLQLGLGIAYWLTRRRFADATQRGGAPADTPKPARSATDDGPVALLRRPVAWLGLGLFGVYVGMEAAAGQWSFSLFTLSRGTPTALAGALVSAYWASLTLGRVLFGVLVTRVSTDQLLRGCMLVAVLACAVLGLNVPLVSWLALAVLGLVFAPIFPILIAETPRRLGESQTANAVGLQVAVAVAGGAALPALLGIVAARTSLEAIGPCLLAAAIVQLMLYELLVRAARRPRPILASPVQN